jgi:hypothetical protein
MSKLNCGVGDLAITVNCNIKENLGNIVKIVSADGFREWPRHSEMLYTWNVEVATEEGFLFYKFTSGLKALKTGPVPDKYLRRLTPPQGHLIEEFADSEPLQADLLLEECLESAIDA